MADLNSILPDSGVNSDQLAYLVEEQANPSTDYYVLPALSAAGYRVVRCGFDDVPDTADVDGVTIVFVRYIPSAWARLVEATRSQLHRVVFFMDDDVLDVHASTGTQWHYRAKLFWLAARYKGWLSRLAVEMWVSTTYLQKKYADWQPQLVPPMPLAVSGDVCRVFYHGTSSHEHDIRWLQPVMAEALLRDERIAFEIVGDQRVHRLYSGLQRVTVVHQMKWPAYQIFLGMRGRHIGLVPQLDLPFNLARSHTKFFDITRCGAVGIYAAGSACADVVSHGVDGLVVPMEQGAWVEAILELAKDEAKRLTLLENAEKMQGKLATAR